MISHLNNFEKLTYFDALDYLYRNFKTFPEDIPDGGPTRDISLRYWNNHRFIRTPDGEIVFGDCIVPGITKRGYNEYVSKLNTAFTI